MGDRIICQSRPKIDKVHTERINIRTNLFIQNECNNEADPTASKKQKTLPLSEKTIWDTSNGGCANVLQEMQQTSMQATCTDGCNKFSQKEMEILFPELKRKSSRASNPDLVKFVKAMVAHNKRQTNTLKEAARGGCLG